MKIKAFRRRRIRALILGLAVGAAAVLVVPVAGARPEAPPPQVDAIAAEQAPPPQVDALAAEQAPIVPLVAERFVEPATTPLPVERLARPESTSVSSHPDESTQTLPVPRWFRPATSDTTDSTNWGDFAIGGAVIGCLLLAGGVAFLVTRRRDQLATSVS